MRGCSDGISDFDMMLDREKTAATKWMLHRGRDVLPFWIADMDFATPPFIREAIVQRLEHPVLGYTEVPDQLVHATVNWAAHRFNWKIDPDWLVWIPGVVPGLNIAVQTVCSAGDSLLLNTPIYPPFLRIADANRLRQIASPMIQDPAKWLLDFDDLRKKAHQSKVFLFCNPQNPTGRVFSRRELREFAEIMLSNDVVIVSDEIHWGLVLDESQQHVPIASLDDAIANQTITLLAPTKTYNFAGLNVAVAIISNEKLREDFEDATTRAITSPSVLAYAACTAAFNDRSNWLDELLDYLRSNHALVYESINSLEGVRTTRVEGTHLSWIDANELCVADPTAYFEAFGVGLSDGVEFGFPGFVRFNFAAPRSLVERGIERFTEAVRCAHGS